MTRVGSVKALYPKGYRFDGSCPKCGSFDHDMSLWEGGCAALCCLCGGWTCYHTVGTATVHTRAGLWKGGKREPAGCPFLTTEPSTLRSNALEWGGCFLLPRAQRPMKRRSEAITEQKTDSDRAGEDGHRPGVIVSTPALDGSAGSPPRQRGEEAGAFWPSAPAGRPARHTHGGQDSDGPSTRSGSSSRDSDGGGSTRQQRSHQTMQPLPRSRRPMMVQAGGSEHLGSGTAGESPPGGGRINPGDAVLLGPGQPRPKTLCASPGRITT